MNRDALRRLDKEALIDLILAQAEAIEALTAQVAALTARVAELEAKLDQPPKTPDNSSLPPSKGQKPSAPGAPKAKAQAHAGAHRPLHPNPTSRREFRAAHCQRCGVDVADAPQFACESYDRIEIPAIAPEVTRVSLLGGVCCGKRFKAPPPDLAPGSPFGANLRAFVIYLRSVQVADERGLWTGFLRRNPPTREPPAFPRLQEELRRFFGPIIASLGAPEGAQGTWDPHAGVWRDR